MSEKCQFLGLVLQAMFIVTALYLCCCEGTSTTLSPSGMVFVCPGGKVLLTCERMSGSFMHWTVSVPRLTMPRESIITRTGVVSTTLQFNSTAFTITRTSSSPLTSQMMVNNVTTAINGSTIYCSEDSNENGAPMATINVINEESDNPLNVSLMSHFLSNSVTVTLQWPRKDGEVYNINVLSGTPHTELANTTLTRHDSVVMNLTVSYNTQYNVSIVSSLCGVTTTKVLNYVTCDLPSQLLERPVVVDTGSLEIPHREGQFITYMCILSGFILTGSNASVCTRNREWEPDPGEVDCIADCGVPSVNINVKTNYNSTVDGSILILTCENEINTSSNTTDEQILRLSVTCHSSGNWIPDPTQFICSLSTTVPPGFTTERKILNTSLIIVIVISGVILITVLIGLLLIIICVIKRKCVATKTSKTPKKDLQNQEPTYEEVSDTHHKGIQMEGNAAYGKMILASKDYLST